MRTFLLLIGTAALVVALWLTSTMSGSAARKASPPSQLKERPLSIVNARAKNAKRATTKPPKKGVHKGAAVPAEIAKKPNAEDCDTGCASVKSKTPALTQDRFHTLMQQFAGEALQSGAKALETLLFYGKTASKFMKTEALPPLSPGHLNFLKKELKRTHALLWFRIKDEKGVVRASFHKRIEIGGHFHFEAQKINSIQRPSFGGKSKRVGLHHIWVRI